MSVLIKGLNLPKDGTYLDLVITEDGVVRCYGAEDEIAAEAIELPEDHGDLIDTDWLKEECKEPEVWWETETQMKRILANAPVVIPAERSD